MSIITAYHSQILYCAITVIFTSHAQQGRFYVISCYYFFFIAVSLWEGGGVVMLRKQVFEVEFFFFTNACVQCEVAKTGCHGNSDVWAASDVSPQ